VPTCNFRVQLEELGERIVGGKALDPVVGDPVLGPALRALDLPLHIVHQALHAGVQAVGVLAWQQLGRPVAVQADAAGEQLVELLHLGQGAGGRGARPYLWLRGTRPGLEPRASTRQSEAIYML
jgi:hypothetical protein